MRKYFVLFALNIWIFSGCIASEPVDSRPKVSVHIDVDPHFREFYESLGGSEYLGPVISPLYVDNNVKYQYTLAGLMAHDPRRSATQRYFLAPIGLDMEVTEPSVSPPSQPNTYYVDGHIIFNDFLSLYNRLGGSSVVGSPLTEMHYNLERKRYEQFFENLGFYRLESESNTSVHLLAYGAWKCGKRCRNSSPGNSSVVLPNHIGEEFQEAVSRLGPGFTGFAISKPYYTPDGYLEQVFENMVLVIDPESPGSVILRSVTSSLGYLPDPPVLPKDGDVYTFITATGEKGYNVPNYFSDYLAQHGGLEVAGQPIGEEILVQDKVYRQCFTNLCLERREDFPEYLYIRPSPLGYMYHQLPVKPLKDSNNRANTQTTSTPPSIADSESSESVSTAVPSPVTNEAREITLQIWEPLVSSGQSQEIKVRILENGAPLPYAEPFLILVLPDGERKTYHLYPTNSNGESTIEVDPIMAPNGTLVPYQACITDISGQRVCLKDNYLIWEENQS